MEQAESRSLREQLETALREFDAEKAELTAAASAATASRDECARDLGNRLEAQTEAHRIALRDAEVLRAELTSAQADAAAARGLAAAEAEKLRTDLATSAKALEGVSTQQRTQCSHPVWTIRDCVLLMTPGSQNRWCDKDSAGVQTRLRRLLSCARK
jgi:hypothetical protein